MNEVILAISGFLLSMGVYVLLRLRSLKIKYKSSDKNRFLDFFEEDYLESTKRTWRRRWSFVYNSKIYSILNIWYAITCIILSILCFVATIVYKVYAK